MSVTGDEQVLCNLFAEVIGCDEVGPHDDFFALGGHSVMAMALVARICEVMQVQVGVATLFDQPTPHRLAAQLVPEDS
jgi:hypothetical protein